MSSLLLLHFVAPLVHPQFFERIADTLIGSGLSWAFSYLLPYWERHDLPRTVRGLLAADAVFAEAALKRAPVSQAYRLARKGCPAPVIDGFSGEQRLFISFAQIWHEKLRDAARIERLKVDPHSPPQFRANGTLRNQSSFVEAFDVKPGDAMYLPKEARISLWQTDHDVVCPGKAP